MLKKAIILVLVFALSVLCACGKNTSNIDDIVSETIPEESITSATTENQSDISNTVTNDNATALNSDAITELCSVIGQSDGQSYSN